MSKDYEVTVECMIVVQVCAERKKNAEDLALEVVFDGIGEYLESIHKVIVCKKEKDKSG